MLGVGLLLGACRAQELPQSAVRAKGVTVHELRSAPGELVLPKKVASVKFAVIG